MPLVTFPCPACQKVLKSPTAIPAGRKIKCPTCGASFARPSQETGVTATPPAAWGAITTAPRRIPAAAPDEKGAASPPKPDQAGRRKSRRRRILAGVALLLLAGAGVYLLRGRGAAGGEPDPLAYVPPGTEFLAGVDFTTVLNDAQLGPGIETVVREQANAGEFLDRCSRETGLSTAELLGHALLATKLDALQGAMPPGLGGPGRAAGDGPVTFILHTTRPFDPTQIARAASDSRRHTAHGKTYYEISDGEMRTLYMPWDRIIVLSSLPAGDLDAVFTTDGAAPALSGEAVALVRGVEANPCWAVVPFEKPARARRDRLSDALARAKGMAMWGASDGDRLRFGVNVACNDAAGAAEMAEAVEAAWKKQKAQLAGLELGLLFMPQTGQAYRELTGSLRFRAEGTTARATAEVSRKTFTDAGEELQQLQQQGGGLPGVFNLGGGLPQLPGRRPK